jgi:tripartite-type tricarboxylate transporter receptor subunit TctC
MIRLKPLAIALLMAASSSSAPAQPAAAPYPDKPVRIIVSYAAGNITDVLARTLSQRMAEEWKQGVIIENRPGQGGSLGALQLLKQPADGYTLLFSAMAALAINPHLYPGIGFDALKDFQPIIGVAYPHGLLYANAALPVSSVPELVALSRSRPGTLNYGSAGSGTVPHLNVEALKARTGTPRPVIERVERTVAALLKEPAVEGKIRGAGMGVLGLGPDAFAKRVESDYRRLGLLVRELNLKAD